LLEASARSAGIAMSNVDPTSAHNSIARWRGERAGAVPRALGI
jgi:hypothetical protein